MKRLAQMCRIPALVSMAIAAFVAGGLHAGPMKDVTDPVLQEIISTFGPRMPRFVEKHGSSIFVADGPITRGALMHAFYEYDKSLKLPRKDFVTRQEFDELQKKFSGETRNQAGAKIDIMQIINDLQPNMPILLDHSLNNSKVFNAMKNELLQARVETGARPAGGIEQTKTELSELSRRVEKLEKMPGETVGQKQPSARDGIGRQEYDAVRDRLALLEKSVSAHDLRANIPEELKRNVSQTQNDIALLTKKMEKIERENRPVADLAKDGAVRQEMDDLKNKLVQLEKRLSAAPPASAAGDDARESVVKTQNELERLARKLEDIERRPAAVKEPGPAKNLATRKDIEEIHGKLSVMEKNMGGRATVTPEDVKKEIAQTKRELSRMDKRIDEIERVPAETGGTYRSGAPAHTSVLTKISFGLSMVAALFIAR